MEDDVAPLSDEEIRWLRTGLEDLRLHGVSIGPASPTMTKRLYATILTLSTKLVDYREVVLAVATTEREDDIPGDPNSTRIPVKLVDRARVLCPLRAKEK